MVMDQVTDRNKALLFRLNTLVPFPDFVKEATETTQAAADELESLAFADRQNRLFPIHTPADTWLSREYFDKFAKDEMDLTQAALIRENLDIACSFWNIPEQPVELLQKAAEDEGTLISYNLKGETQATARVRNQEDMDKVAVDLSENHRRYPWEMRRDVARQLLKAGYSREGQPMADLQKMAAYGVGSVENAMDAVQKRIGACRNRHHGMVAPLEEMQGALQKSAKNGIISPLMLDKTAGLLDAVDRFSDLHRHYPAPEKDLFSVTVTHMDNFNKNAVKLPSGQTVEKQALEDFQVRRFLRDDLGIESTEENVVEKVASLTPHKSQLVYDFLREYTHNTKAWRETV